MLCLGVKQKFIVQASWWDDFYERLVRSVKATLKIKFLKNQC